MRHRRCRRRAMPMFRIGGAGYDIAGTNLDLGFALALRPTKTRRDDQRLAAGMGVPRRARTRFKRDERAAELRRSRRLEQRIDADVAGEVLDWPFEGRA